jgi:hypothetical protein
MAPRGPIYLILSMGLLFLPSATFGQSEGETTAQPVCGLRTPIVQALAEIGETTIGVGEITGGKYAYEITVNPETGNWTVLITDQRGAACLMAAGTKWRSR